MITEEIVEALKSGDLTHRAEFVQKASIAELLTDEIGAYVLVDGVRVNVGSQDDLKFLQTGYYA